MENAYHKNFNKEAVALLEEHKKYFNFYAQRFSEFMHAMLELETSIDSYINNYRLQNKKESDLLSVFGTDKLNTKVNIVMDNILS